MTRHQRRCLLWIVLGALLGALFFVLQGCAAVGAGAAGGGLGFWIGGPPGALAGGLGGLLGWGWTSIVQWWNDLWEPARNAQAHVDQAMSWWDIIVGFAKPVLVVLAAIFIYKLRGARFREHVKGTVKVAAVAARTIFKRAEAAAGMHHTQDVP